MSTSEATAAAYLTTLYGGTTTDGEGAGAAEGAGASASSSDDVASSIKALADQGISGTIEQTSVAKFGMQLHEFEWEDDVRLRF